MAETTTTRFSLRRWSAGTDTPSRAEFDTNFANLETLAAIDKQGTFAARPAAGVVGTYYWDTTNSLLWRDNGSAWFVVGSKVRDGLFNSSTTASVPLTVDALSGQTANLQDWKVNGGTIASLTAAGDLAVRNLSNRKALHDNTGGTASDVVLDVKGAVSQSGALINAKNSGNTSQFSVAVDGQIQASYLRSGSTSSVINANASTNVANMSYWAGTPAFEVRAQGSAAFNDFMYLKHDTAAASAATRRLGLVMKAGAEDSTGATRSAAMYLYSTAASFDTPSLRIDVRDVNLWEMDPINGSVTSKPVHSNGGYLRATPSGTGAFQFTNAWMGTQGSGNNPYFRAGTNTSSFYWYGGGSHSDSNGDPNGGTTMMSLIPSSIMGALSVGRVLIAESTSVDPGVVDPAFQIGSTSGFNLVMDAGEIQARNNGVASTLQIQHDGGDLRLGLATTRVQINDVRVHVSNNGTQPNGPLSNFDLWIDVRPGEGLKYRSGSSWIKI